MGKFLRTAVLLSLAVVIAIIIYLVYPTLLLPYGLLATISLVLSLFGFFDKVFSRIFPEQIFTDRDREIIDKMFERKYVEIVDKATERVRPSVEEERRGREKDEEALRRLRWSIKRVGLSVDELLKHYDKSLKCIILCKCNERGGVKGSKPLRDRIASVGFRYILAGVYVLPPGKTPQQISGREELSRWVNEVGGGEESKPQR